MFCTVRMMIECVSKNAVLELLIYDDVPISMIWYKQMCLIQLIIFLVFVSVLI